MVQGSSPQHSGTYFTSQLATYDTIGRPLFFKKFGPHTNLRDGSMGQYPRPDRGYGRAKPEPVLGSNLILGRGAMGQICETGRWVNTRDLIEGTAGQNLRRAGLD